MNGREICLPLESVDDEDPSLFGSRQNRQITCQSNAQFVLYAQSSIPALLDRIKWGGEGEGVLLVKFLEVAVSLIR